MTKILPDDFKIENPCERCLTRKLYTGEDCMPSVECRQREKYQDQQSILSQMKEVDLDALWTDHQNYRKRYADTVDDLTFSQFIKEQEGKDGKH